MDKQGGPCAQGYYCPEGSSNASQSSCNAGTYCPAASSAPVACPVGTLCSIALLSRLTLCPSGSFCNTTGLSVITGACQGGYYCLNGSSASTGSGLCAAGYYCQPGSSSATQAACPLGTYCADGSSTSIACPAASYCPTTGMSTSIRCLAGLYCETTGLSAASGLCAPGYYCPTGASSGRQFGCTAGAFCPGGSGAPVACPAGALCATALLAASQPCPSGKYCGATGLTAESSYCKPGFYSLGGASACSQCPSGSFSSNTSSITCLLCTPGYSANTSSSTCTSCPPGMQCLLGAPVPTLPRRIGQSVFNPFTVTHAQNQATILGIGRLVLGSLTPIVLVIIALGVAFEKVPFIKRFVSTNCGWFDWSRLDLLFPDIHYRIDGHAMVFKKTAFGAAMSIAAFLAFVGVGIALGVNSVMFPVYSSSISPQPPPWEPHGVYQLTVTVFGGGGVADYCTNSGMDNGFGVYELDIGDWSVAPTRSKYNPGDGSCTLTWRCGDRCAMIAGNPATLQLRSPPRSWATHISFTVTTPVFASDSTPLFEFGSAPFQFERSFYVPLGADQAANSSLPALRGKAIINLALTPYIVNASTGETKAVAFEPSLLGISFGSVTTAETFDFTQPDFAGGFVLNFVLTPNTLSLVFTASSTAVSTFLVLLSSLAGSMVGVFSVLVKRLESMFQIRDVSSADATKHVPQIDVESGASTGLESIEMRDVGSSANRTIPLPVMIGSPSAPSQSALKELSETVRDHDSEIEHLKLLHQQNMVVLERKATAQQQDMVAHEQSIQHLVAANHQLTATLAELVQLVPASDRARQLQQQIASIPRHSS